MANLLDSAASLIFKISADGAQAIEEAKRVAAETQLIADKASLELARAKAEGLAGVAELQAASKAASEQARIASLEAKVLQAEVNKTAGQLAAGSKELDKLFGSVTGLGSAASGAAEALGPLGIAVGVVTVGAGAAAVGVAGLAVEFFNLTKNASDYGAAIYDASIKTGLSSEKISALKFLGDESGVSIQQLTTAVDFFEKKLGTAAEGSKSATVLLKRLGLEPQSAYKDLDASFEKVISKLAEMHTSTAKTTLVMETFGAKTGANVLKVLDAMHGESLPKVIAKLKEMGITLDDEDTKNADTFRKTLATLEAQFKGTSSKILLDFAPDIVRGMKLISTALEDNQSDIEKWATNTKHEVGGLIAYFNDLNTAVKNYRDQTSKPFLQKVDEAIFSPETIEINRKNPIGAPGTSLTTAEILAKLRQRGISEEQLHPPDGLGVDPEKLFRFPEPIAGKEPKAPHTGKSFGETEAEKFHKKVLELAETHGFTESSYKRSGTQINAGSLHGSGLADDFSVRGKSVEEMVGLIAGGIKDGFRAIDETVHQPGITSHGKHIHLERGGTKASLFGTADTYGGGEEGEATLAYLKKIDADRLNKTGGTKGDIEAYTEKEKAKIEKERADRIQDYQDKIKEAKEFDDEDKADRLAELDDLHEKGLIKETEYAHEVGAIKLAQLEKDLAANDALLKNKDVQDSPEKKKEIQQESYSLARQIGQQQAENNRNEAAALAKINEEYDKELDALRKIREENRQGEIDQMDAAKADEREILVEQTKVGTAKDRLLALKVLREFDIEENQRKATEARLQAEIDRDEELDAAKEIKDKDLQIKQEDEIIKRYERKLQLINQLETKGDTNIKKGADPAITDAERSASGGIAGQAADILGGLFGHADNKDANGKIKSQADYLKGVYKDIAGSAKQATGDMIQGLAGLVEQWITTGKFSGAAALQMAAGIAAGMAIQSGIKALYEYAEGMALAANPVTAYLAPGHFAAATAYAHVAAIAGVVAAGTGIAGRLAAGNSASGAMSAATGGGTGSTATTTTVDRNTAIVDSQGRYAGRGDNQPIQHVVNLVIPRGMMANAVVNDFNNGGPVRGLLLKVVNG